MARKKDAPPTQPAAPAAAAPAAPPSPAPAVVDTGKAALLALVKEHVEEIQNAILRDFPNNPAIKAEFKIGAPWPKDVKAAVALGRAVDKAAADYSANLISRGIDAAKVKRLGKALDDLEKT